MAHATKGFSRARYSQIIKIVQLVTVIINLAAALKNIL